MGNDRVTRGAARIGLIAKGVLYGLMAVLIGQLAFFGARGARTDSEGALRTLAGRPFGSSVLLVLAVGFALYAVWQWWCAWDGDDAPSRLAAAGRGLIWLAVAFTAGRIVLGGGDTNGQEEGITAQLLGTPFGTWLVAAVGAVIVIIALALLRHIRDEHYLDDLRPLPRRTRRAVCVAATVGIGAKTTVYSLAGAFLIRAALRHDPDSGVGLDGALSQVAQEPYGRHVLSVCAIGMAAYALWCGLRARYEDIERSDG